MSIRINKYLSEKGVCSRRAADKIVEEGRVTVNGIPAVMGQTVEDTDEVFVDGKIINKDIKKVVIALNKPVGVVVSESDSHAEKIITELIDYPDRLTYAGRLDKDSEGLILLTNDGDFINRAMKGINGHEKEYIVTLDKEVMSDDIKRLEKGIYIKDLDRKTKACKIKKIGKCSVNIILTEGLNRQIRRMFKIVGYNVIKLKRIRVINIMLNDLKPGQYLNIYIPRNLHH
mgnify:CR=1 FL=1